MNKMFAGVLLLVVVLFMVVSCGPVTVEGNTSANVTAESQDVAADSSAKVDVSAESSKENVDVEANEHKVAVSTGAEKVDVAVSGSGSSLKTLLAGKGAKYTADYDITTEGKLMSYTMSMDLPKFAMYMKVDGIETKTIMDGEVVHSCNTAQGSWMCVKVATPTPTASQEVSKQVDSGATIESVGSCLVVGETGSKYKVTSKEGYEATVCYTNDGVLLEMETVSPKAVSLKATRVVRSVDSEMFVVPAASQDLQTMLPPGVKIPTQ